jgi:hypothetical protein
MFCFMFYLVMMAILSVIFLSQPLRSGPDAKS